MADPQTGVSLRFIREYGLQCADPQCARAIVGDVIWLGECDRTGQPFEYPFHPRCANQPWPLYEVRRDVSAHGASRMREAFRAPIRAWLTWLDPCHRYEFGRYWKWRLCVTRYGHVEHGRFVWNGNFFLRIGPCTLLRTANLDGVRVHA